MSKPDPTHILSRLSDEEFFDRETELAHIYAVAAEETGGLLIGAAADRLAVGRTRRRGRNALVLGRPRAGKTELLRKSFDRLFNEAAERLPFYYAFRGDCLDPERFGRDYVSRFLAQFIAFRRGDPRLIAAADEPLAAIARAALPEDYPWVRALVESLARAAQGNDSSAVIRCALGAPGLAGVRTRLRPVVLLDSFDLVAGTGSGGPFEGTASEFSRALSAERALAAAPVYVLTGLRRPLVETMPPDEAFLESVEMIPVEPMAEEPLERMIKGTAARLGVDVSDSSAELMIHQLDGDLFYIRALFDRAAATGSGLRTFMELERVYTDELLNGRIAHYLAATLRNVARETGGRRAALEALNLVVQSRSAVPADALLDRMREHASDAEAVLARLHACELLDVSYGFVQASSDPVLADYVGARYRTEIAGARRPVAGEELLREKLKHSYRLMMSRYNRSVEAQLVETLSRFDFQSVPASLLSEGTFEERYRGMSRVHVRRSLEDEADRVRLPQMVLVNAIGSGDQPGVNWRSFAASGFEGGIYSDANETVWLIALINSKEPLDVESLGVIDQRIESGMRGAFGPSLPAGRVVRWYISKESFSPAAAGRLTSAGVHRSTYLQLDLLHDYLTKLSAQQVTRRPATEFELVIPVEDEAELIAARTAEQIARAADFSSESISQIKTALIEACINAAEHGDSPDRKIYQRFTIEDDRLVIRVSNKGNVFGSISGEAARAAQGPLSGSRGRGLQIIRALMDEVYFERTDDGTTLVMTKMLTPSETP